ncbi:putative gustatory receptor 28b [Athalia rosae]|uniref:putative gustatory receptor 28b n=1 Tax=Athalia rosae TaxID=37344 RepID=UPI002033380F|nr:putative gustatory receptor 28b [Athalia rosae]
MLEGAVGKRQYRKSYFLMLYNAGILTVTIIGLNSWTKNNTARTERSASHVVVEISINLEKILGTLVLLVMFISGILGGNKFATSIVRLSLQDITLKKLGGRPNYAANIRRNYFRMGIILSIMSLLWVVDHFYQMRYNVSNPLKWVVSTCPNFLQVFNTCLFVDVVFLLKERFVTLNKHLTKMIEEMKNVPIETISKQYGICGQIRTIAMIHGALCEAAFDVNQAFGINIVVGVGNALIISTIALYYVFEEIKYTTGSYFRIVGSLNWGILNSIHVVYMVTVCNMARTQASLTGKLIHKFKIRGIDTTLNNVIQAFSLQLHHEKIEFSGAGLFRLDATLIQSIAGAVTTYLVILIQFDSSTSSYFQSGNSSHEE